MDRVFRLLCVCGVFAAAALGQSAQSGYLVSVSTGNFNSQQVTLFSHDLRMVGNLQFPGRVNAAFVTQNGDRLIVISTSDAPSISLNFVDILPTGLGTPRTIPIANSTLRRVLLSPDGSRLILATISPSQLFEIDLPTERLAGDPKNLPWDLSDMVFTKDGEFLLILTGWNFIQPVRFSDRSWDAPVPVAGIPGDVELSLSVSPAGPVYVSAPNTLIRLSARPPFAEEARMTLTLPNFTQPGKLHFTPSGGKAFAASLKPGEASLAFFDLKSSTNSSSPVAGSSATGVAVATDSLPGQSVPEQISQIQVVSENAAYGYAPAARQIFLFRVTEAGGITAQDVRIDGSPLRNIVGIASSGEIPQSRRFYLSDGEGRIFSITLPEGSASVLQRSEVSGSLGFVFGASSNPVASLEILGGPSFSMTSTTARFFVRALDDDGRPVKGAQVQFSTPNPDVRLSAQSATTNGEGYSWVDVTAPLAATDVQIHVSTSGGVSASAAITVLAPSPGPAADDPSQLKDRIMKVSGDGQLAIAGSVFRQLVIRAEKSDGTPLQGRTVRWSSPHPRIKFLGSTTAQTAADGTVGIYVFAEGVMAANLAFEQFTIYATTDLGTATFRVTQYPPDLLGVPYITLQAPDPIVRSLTLKLGKPTPGALQIDVRSGLGDGRPILKAIPNVILSVTSENQDPANGPVVGCSEGVTLSDNIGNLTCTLLAKGKTGTTYIRADVGNLVYFDMIRVDVEPGEPVPPAIVSGNNQTGKTGTTLKEPLVARILDAGGNPLPGTQVTWRVSNATALTLVDTITEANANGLVSSGVKLGNIVGTFQVTVSAGGQSAIFNVTVQSPVTTLRKVSGDEQVGVEISKEFPKPLVIVVLDAQDKPVPNVPVTWGITGPGALSATSTLTGSDGKAQVTVTAGATPGQITVTATAVNLAAVSFSLQSRLPGPGVTAQSFRNYATGQIGVSPGNLVILSASGIARNVNGAAVANLLVGRLPIEFKGLFVEFRSGGKSSYAPIYWIVKEGDLEEALIQVPYEITGNSVDVNVSIDGIATLVTGVPVTPLSPGMIEDAIDGRRAAIVIRSDGLVVTKATPARRGETVRLYAIGLGQTTPLAETNRVGRPGQKVKAKVLIGINDAGVDVLEAKLAENLIGIYEIIFKIPEDAREGDGKFGLVAEQPDGSLVDHPGGSVLPIGPPE